MTSNLILVHWPGRQAPEDLAEIARLVEERAPEIAVSIIDTKDQEKGLEPRFADQPTVVVSIMEVRKALFPDSAIVFEGNDLPKSAQYERYRENGIPVPDWHVIGPETALTPDDWGEYVIVKPELARKGAEIRIKKTRRVRYKAPEDYAEDHPARRGGMIAQKFVYTGRWPNHFRVVTLFGKALFSIHCEADHSFRPLESRDGFRGAAGAGGAPVVSNKQTSTYTLNADPEIVDMACRAHAAFPELPLLGHDLVRDADTGEVFLLESNTRGDVWLISSGTGMLLQRQNGIDLAGQFGALSVAADALVSKVREVTA